MHAAADHAALSSATTDDPRWAAVMKRDRSADGSFYYSVKTTGVYCRPSCASRRAHPQHVRFHLSCEEAEQAGFRPCKRCKPDRASLAEQNAAIVARACAIIEASEQTPTLEILANQLGVSPYHFHRLFRQITGLTPRQYAAAHRENRLRGQLIDKASITEAIFDAGYNSSGRFYAQADKVLGMTPTRYRAGGAGMQIKFAVGECSLGAILVAHSGQGICAILIGDDPQALVQDLQDRFARAVFIGGDKDFETLVARVIGFVDAPRLGLDLPLDVRGTAFQQRVWQALRAIPAGQTVSYTELARRIGAPAAVRAVASACAANAIAVAIPCHRVVRTDGSLSGYRWGVERKRSLLDKEADE